MSSFVSGAAWRGAFSSAESRGSRGNSSVSRPVVPDFCRKCGTLLKLPVTSLRVKCDRCHEETTIDQSENRSNKVTVLDFAVEDEAAELLHDRATINETCTNCGHHTVYFWTMQTRSADEGQTVFYECEQCSFKWSTFN